MTATEFRTLYTETKRTLFDIYYRDLNPKQREAVYQVNGPLLILAGTGSGKITVLVNRLAHIIRYGQAYETEYLPEGTTEADAAALEAAVSEMERRRKIYMGE